MKSQRDYSGIKELFYSDVNDIFKSDLKGFILYAFNQYAEEYLTFDSTELMDFCFEGETNPDLKVKLSISRNKGHPDLTSVTIYGESDNSNAILSSLSGKLEANYSNIPLNSIDDKLIVENSKNNTTNKIRAGIFSLYLSYDLEKTPRVINGRIEKFLPLINKSYGEYAIEEVKLTDYDKKLLTKAQHITVNNSFYTDNDSNKDLFFESCDIYNVSEDKCIWKYKLNANNGFLSSKVFPKMDKVFQLIVNGFSSKTIYRMKVDNVSQNLYGGGMSG